MSNLQIMAREHTTGHTSNLLLNPPPSRNTNAYASAPASEEITNAVPASTLVLESSMNPTIASKPIISIQQALFSIIQ